VSLAELNDVDVKQQSSKSILSIAFEIHNEKQKYHTVGTVPKSNRKTKIPHCRNRSKI